ncbi:MAG: DNA gyrase subunit B, partial [Candidatus Aminicenantes bacterium]|nr:DNA gyrase subunit B [Candidatus Aminicenantes bacterium]
EILEGEKFRKFFRNLMAKRSYAGFFERKNFPQFIVRALVDAGVEDQEFLRSKRNVERLQKALAQHKDLSFSVSKDQEYGVFELTVKYPLNGLQVTIKIGVDLVTSAEYRNLFRIYKELEGYRGPYSVLTNGDGHEKQVLENENKLLEFLFEKGKKGVSIQRYKGLGEMTPTQLWETTMDPERRSLLKVSILDAAEVDRIFGILMGDEVESRRRFIESNAMEALNLDI